ncbi:MAG TPA: hypothetical protein PKB03_03190 [Baekduia sp.]|nr:hypothetical protein [Baekduia sp.]
MSDQGGQPLTEEDIKNMSEEELQELYLQQYNAEMRELRVEDLIAQSLITLVNVGARRAGLLPGAEDELDPAQLHKAIEAARSLLPIVEAARPRCGPDPSGDLPAADGVRTDSGRRRGCGRGR